MSNTWSLRVDLRAQRLSQHYGYAVLRCDNRGSARRGIAFEQAIKWTMGDVELADQITALRWYAEQGIVDMSKVKKGLKESLSTHPIKTPCQYTLSTHILSSQYILVVTHPINTPCQHTLF